MEIVSLFSGCGGLDLGFELAGFSIVWANDNDKDVWETYTRNFPGTYLDKRDLRVIPVSDIPDCVGIIGGPPCQSWSEAGNRKGIEDERGRLVLNYIDIISRKRPYFFLFENVAGILHRRHKKAFNLILTSLEKAGYDIYYKLIDTYDYLVPQNRKRVFIIGFRKDLQISYSFPKPFDRKKTLRDAIYDLKDNVVEPLEKNRHNPKVIVPNHEYYIGSFSSIYMSRNRVRSWNEPSFTIQASGRHAPIHPQANKMIKVSKDKYIFDPESPYPYRRLSVRECARIQTFPDDFIFVYEKLDAGYKMIGNAVPVKLAEILAVSIKETLRRKIGKERTKILLPLFLA
ncbi:DNA-cytosine methyltransferase [Desulfurobacterium thermolithotrophum DSM 11699]|uniref:DNA (cytosine-5-)-methyltransferase n=1 Tax=Desulfurobacterium thermolithotrophum (strain DSM 11699 / BSA) TaxID=868864 RepID=F0S2I5_DESTD|nr:DNA cytosine methyltransferase [Desulfurobacterium thermolithotrophum]ADY73057.1 DNA-cytosine methyltransferase [Desulfurobacterium thermolithotrophum DSM 11699]